MQIIAYILFHQEVIMSFPLIEFSTPNSLAFFVVGDVRVREIRPDESEHYCFTGLNSHET